MKPYGTIRFTRRAVAVAVAAGITLCVAAGMRCALTRMQLLPAVLAGSAAWLLLPYRWRPPSVRGRYSVLAVVVLCMVLGFSVMPAVMDPYSAYARIVATVCRPLGVSLLSASVALATLLAVAATSWRHGRYLCNTWCPVGSALSLLSRRSIYHIDVNTDLCVHCLKCVDVCKARCINPADMTVDAARCVTCFNCTDVCRPGAITFRRGQHRLVTPHMQRSPPPPSPPPCAPLPPPGTPSRSCR